MRINVLAIAIAIVIVVVVVVVRNESSAFSLISMCSHQLLRWLKTVSSTYIWIGRYNHCLSFDATIMVSKNCPIIGEHVVIIFLTQ